MSAAGKLLQAYFNFVYNPVYDLSTGKLKRYRKLQEACTDKLDLKDGDRVLCVGLGTGNEIARILEINGNVDITGVDYSSSALRKAQKKATRLGKKIVLLRMDARRLLFNPDSFDRVLCLHVMDFIDEKTGTTREILRVLRNGGQYVITYPSDKEAPGLGWKLVRDNLRDKLGSGKNRLIAYLEFTVWFLVGLMYLPLLLRPNKKYYSFQELNSLLSGFTVNFCIEEEPVYQDFIVYGTK
ncbi:class I SAM-dependent methyltransferase [Chloroflexota bacterium]